MINVSQSPEIALFYLSSPIISLTEKAMLKNDLMLFNIQVFRKTPMIELGPQSRSKRASIVHLVLYLSLTMVDALRNHHRLHSIYTH